jgi:hypothetical protein
MKKLSVILVSALLITSFFIACNTKAPSSPQAEQATATPIGTFTTTPTITPTVTITATMVCGVKFGQVPTQQTEVQAQVIYSRTNLPQLQKLHLQPFH